MYQTQVEDIQRYSARVDDAIAGNDMQKFIALKENIIKCRVKLEDYYYDFSILEEFVKDVEYEKNTYSKDIADLALEKFELFLSVISDKL